VGGVKLGTPLAGTGYHYFRAYAVALQSDGSIIVAGADNWGTTGDTAHPLLMRFFPTSSSSLMAAGGATTAPSDIKPLTLAQVQPPLTAGIARWQAPGTNASGLGSLDVRITNLPDATPDLASGNAISLGSGAAAWDSLVHRSSRWGRMSRPVAWSYSRP
jgi:hypothetical protein